MRIPIMAISMLKKYTVLAAVCGFVSLPGISFGQIEESSSNATQEAARPSSGSSLWGNSAASGIGSTSIIPSAGNQREDVNAAGTVRSINGVEQPRSSTGSTIRLRTGPTTDGRDPGGNPDVPFDTNMNICFLIAGLLFSVWVIKKKQILKPAVSN
jgi:hypothetical protein